MDGKDVVNTLKYYMSDAKQNGITSMKVSDFEHRIDLAEKHACDCVEHKKMEQEREIELFKSVISSGANAIKAALLINGGGAVALLAFAGKIQESIINVDENYLATGLLYFCMGVLFSAISSGTTYLSQLFYSSISKTKYGYVLHGITILMIVTSYYFFFSAIYNASLALGLNPISIFSWLSFN